MAKRETVRGGAPVDLTESQIANELSAYGISVSGDQIRKIREYVFLLLKWNQSIGLTTITNPAEIVGRHFGESMFLTKLLPVENCRLADVGSGAGFPGLALKIACPDMQLISIESNKKKSAFLADATRALELSAVEIRSERFEEIRPETVAADIIACRALGGLPTFLAWAKTALTVRGNVALWLGGEDSARISGIPGWIWQRASRIPNSQRRFVLIGRPAPDFSDPQLESQ